MFALRFLILSASVLLLAAFRPEAVVAQCLAEYTASADVGSEIREGNPMTFTFTPTASAGFDGCAGSTVAINFSLRIADGSVLTENDLSSTGSALIWNDGDGAPQPFDVVTTPLSDDVLEVSELADLTVRVSATTGTGQNVPSTISGNNAFSFTVLDPNKPPVLSAFSAPDVTEDDGPVALGGAAGVSDENEDDQTMTVTVTGGTVTAGTTDIMFGGGGNGTASFTMAGTLAALNAALDAATFTPTPDLSGPNTATVTLESNDGLVDATTPAVTTISIAHVADTPTISDTSTLEDTQNTDGLVVSRAAVDGAEVTHFQVTDIVGGTLFLNDGTTPVASGSFVTAADGTAGLKFLPSPDSPDDGSVSVRASISADASGVAGSTATAAVAVTAVNDVPSFSAGSDVTVAEDSGAHTTSGWATNRSPGPADEAGQELTFNVSNSMPALFSTQPAVDGATGDLTFTPAQDANGSAVVTISVSDDGGVANNGDDTSEDQTFTITITPVNDAPVLTVPPSQTMLEDGSLTFSTGNGNAISVADLDADEAAGTVEVTLTATSTVTLSGTTGLTFTDGDGAADASMTFTGSLSVVNAALEGLVYVPSANAVTGASLTVSVSDVGNTGAPGPLTDSGSIDIALTPVNDAPSFTAGSDITVAEDSGAHTTSGWATNRSPGPPDEAGQALTFNVSNNNTGLFATQPAVDGATGDLTFTPAQDANGSAVVTISVSDDGGVANNGDDTSDDQTFTITITPVNDAPVLTVPPAQTMLEDGSLTFSTGNGNAISVADLDADEAAGSVQVTLTATSTLTLSGTNGLSFSEGDGTADVSMIFTGSISDVNAALDGMEYVPSSSAVVGASLTVTVSDVGNTGAPGPLTDSGSIDIGLTPVNDAPSFTAGSDITVAEDSGAHTTSGWATNRSPGPADEAGQELTFNVSNNNTVLFATQPAVDGATGDLTFTPAQDANGSAVVTISVSDNGGVANGGDDTSADQTFTITITPVNDAPVLTVPPAQTMLEDGSLTFSAGNGNAISVLDVDAGAMDLEVMLATTGSLIPGSTTGLTFTEGDPAGDDTLTFRGSQANINAALDGLRKTLLPNQVSDASVVISVSDLGNSGAGAALTDAGVVDVTIGDVNDAPSFDMGPEIEVEEDAGPQTIPAWVNNITPGPADEADQNVTFNVTIGNTSLFSVQPAIDPATGDLTFETAKDAHGLTQIWVNLQDDGGRTRGGTDISPEATVLFRVTPVNDAPTVQTPGLQTIAEDSPLVFSAAAGNAIEVSDVDAGDDVLTMSLSVEPQGTLSLEQLQGTLDELNAALDGLTYTPDSDVSGSATLTIQVSDGALSASESIAIDISPVNNAPTAVDDQYTTFSGTTLTLRPLENDTDVEAGALTLASVSTPASGTAELGTPDGDGRITTILYTAPDEFSGLDTFTYEIQDAQGGSATGTIRVDVTGPGADGDGVDDTVEDGAPNNGDGNGDGVPDSGQTNVTSLTARNSSDYVTVAAPTGQRLARVASPENPSPADFPEGRATPAGFVSYAVEGLASGQSTVVSIYLPEGTVVDGYMKYGPTPDNEDPHWYDFAWDGTTGAQIDGNRIDLYLTDGLRGDDDLTANGTIVDPGAPVSTQNSLPQVASSTFTMDEDDEAVLDLLAAATDADGDSLFVVSASVDAVTSDGPVDGSTGFEFESQGDGTVRLAPAPDHFGTFEILFSVSDGKGSPVPATASVTINPIQDAPVAVADTATTVMNEAVTFNIIENDSDADGDAIFLAQLDSSPSGTATFKPGGSVTFTPATDFFGTVTIGYSISDGANNSGAFVRGGITIHVSEVAGAPVGVEDAVETMEDVAVVVDVLANDTDVNQDALNIEQFTQPANGTVTAGDNRTLLYTPAVDFHGTDVFTYTATDGTFESNVTTVTVVVLPLNDAPEFLGDSEPVLPAPGPLALFTDATVTLGFVEAVDAEGDSLSYRWQLADSPSFATLLFEQTDIPGGTQFDVETNVILEALNAVGVLTNTGERIDLWHRIVATDPDGAEAVGTPSEIGLVRASSVSDEPSPEVPTEVYLSGNYPNPFNPSTTIEFGVPAPGMVRVELFDVQGRLVRSVVNTTLPAGHHAVRVDLSAVPSGVYLYRLSSGSRVLTRTMHLLK